SVVGNGESNYKNIVDEQKYAQDTSTYMNGTYFDEIYHPRTAYEHLHMMPYYETTHPPLGKLIMSIGVAIFGMTPFGWRIMGTLFGIFMLPLLYFFLKKMFGRTRYSVIGTLLFAFDFMHFSLTRMGTIDSYPVFFIIAMFYFMYMFGERAISQARMGTLFGNIRNTKSLTGFLAMSGIAWGLGAASKWIAIYAGAGLAVEFAIIMVMIFKALPEAQKAKYTAFFFKICSVCLLFFVAIPGMIYLLSYVPIVMTGEYGIIFEAMWNNQKYMLDYHGTLTSTHPYSSMWYQWPIDYKPLWAYLAPNESVTPGMVGTISIFGNPLLWWTGIAAFVYSIIVGIQKKSKEVLFISIALLAQYVPWMFVSRAVFIYHFFASTPFMVMFIIYAMRDLEERFGWFKNVSMVFVITCLLLFVAFYPVLTGVPANADYVKLFLVWFNSWSFGV
ncbi:MAG: phospholipid carrier-dependent glycosyltransferase, partial [Oscillospiraceae bacterium]